MKHKVLILFFTASIQLFAQPGIRYELNSINFIGNNYFSSSTLHGLIYSRPSPWWFWKFLHSFSSLGKEPVYFDSTNIQIDLTALKEYYNSNGFFDAKFGYRYTVDTADKKINLYYTIDESKPSYFGKLNLFGISRLPKYLYNNIYKDIALDTNQRFSQEVVQNNTNKFINYMNNNGYIYIRLDSTVILKDTVNYKADVNIYFSLGNLYKIDTVLVTKTGAGANFVEDGLLRDISGIKKGQLYSQDALSQSQLRLYQTGLFNSVMLRPKENDTTDNKVPIEMIANIGLLNEMDPEIILNNQQNAFNAGLGVSYIRKNFLGDARKLTISTSFGVQNIFQVDFGKLIKAFSIYDTTLNGYVDSRIILNQPYLFEKPIFATWETYATINKQLYYYNTLLGTKFTFDFEMPVYTFINHLSASYTVEQSKEDYRTLPDSLAIKLVSDIAADAASTTADNILFPTRGYNLSFHIEEGNSFPQKNSSSAGFYKVQLGGSYYLTLDKHQSSIAAFKLKVGNIQVYYGSFAGVPINRTFFAGGSTSIRGWESNQLVPPASPRLRTIPGITNINIEGGSFLLEGSMEFRRKFWENVGYALFTDFGNTWLGYNTFSWNSVAVAVGFGLRYYTPVAPFRVDFGFKFYDPASHEFLWQKKEHVFQNVVINFGLGEAF